MLAVFNNDVKITMEEKTQVRGNRKIYKSPNIETGILIDGAINLYKGYKSEIFTIKYNVHDRYEEKWYQLNQPNDKYVIQIKGKLSPESNLFILKKVAIQELLAETSLLLNI